MKKRNILSVFKGINDATGNVGFRRGSISTYLGQTGCGKTAILLQEAIHLVKSGHRVLLIDKELSFGDVINWILSIHKKKFGGIKRISFKEIANVYKKFSNDLIIIDGIKTIEDLKTVVKENSPDILILNGGQHMLPSDLYRSSDEMSFYTKCKKFNGYST